MSKCVYALSFLSKCICACECAYACLALGVIISDADVGMPDWTNLVIKTFKNLLLIYLSQFSSQNWKHFYVNWETHAGCSNMISCWKRWFHTRGSRQLINFYSISVITWESFQNPNKQQDLQNCGVSLSRCCIKAITASQVRFFLDLDFEVWYHLFVCFLINVN